MLKLSVRRSIFTKDVLYFTIYILTQTRHQCWYVFNTYVKIFPDSFVYPFTFLDETIRVSYHLFTK